MPLSIGVMAQIPAQLQVVISLKPIHLQVLTMSTFMEHIQDSLTRVLN
jgi:hypothetical protein